MRWQYINIYDINLFYTNNRLNLNLLIFSVNSFAGVKIKKEWMENERKLRTYIVNFLIFPLVYISLSLIPTMSFVTYYAYFLYHAYYDKSILKLKKKRQFRKQTAPLFVSHRKTKRWYIFPDTITMELITNVVWLKLASGWVFI